MLYDRHLESFIAVAEEGSLSKAATRLYISQPALTQQINLLEENLGASLFIRTNRGVKLTSAGEALLKDSKKIITLCEKTVSQVRDAAAQLGGLLRLGVRPDIQSVILHTALSAFAKYFPAVTQEFVSLQVDDLIPAVVDGRIDICEFYDTKLPGREDVGFLSLQKERMVFLVHPDDPLARRTAIALRDLSDAKVALVGEDKTTGTDELRRKITSSGLPINLVTRDRDCAIRIRNGLERAITTAPEGIASYFTPLVPIPMSEDIFTNLGFIHPLDPSVPVTSFLELAREVFA
jgi:DNA-binding transcriptional LysR family regulator